jgi:hypothetical protein
MLSGDIASSGSRVVTCYPGFREAKLCCTFDQLRRTEEAQTRGGPLAIVGATMPPWPGEDEAMESKESGILIFRPRSGTCCCASVYGTRNGWPADLRRKLRSVVENRIAEIGYSTSIRGNADAVCLPMQEYIDRMPRFTCIAELYKA